MRRPVRFTGVARRPVRSQDLAAPHDQGHERVGGKALTRLEELCPDGTRGEKEVQTASVRFSD